MRTIEPIPAMGPTSHRPSNGQGRACSPRPANTHKEVSLIHMRTQHLRAMSQRIDGMAPTLRAGHLARLEEAVKEANKAIEQALDNIAKFQRARAVPRNSPCSGDSAEFRSIEDGGNG